MLREQDGVTGTRGEGAGGGGGEGGWLRRGDGEGERKKEEGVETQREEARKRGPTFHYGVIRLSVLFSSLSADCEKRIN